MKRAFASLVFGYLSVLWASAAELPGVVVQKTSTDGRREITLVLRNPAAAAQEFRLPAGSLFQTAEATRLVTLRTGIAPLPAGGVAELALPAVVLSTTALPGTARSAELLPGTEARLQPLLQYVAAKNDLPRGTSQCAVLALLEDISFRQWEQFQASAQSPAAAADPAFARDILIEALDAVGILREVAPERSFRLQADPELKLRALRQPGTRARALQLFGLTIPGEPTAAGQTPPDLGQLLHTKPGDNCPICRMRAQMERPASDL